MGLNSNYMKALVDLIPWGFREIWQNTEFIGILSSPARNPRMRLYFKSLQNEMAYGLWGISVSVSASDSIYVLIVFINSTKL